MITGSCHCGAVTYTFDRWPEKANSCNCSVCRRLGALWIYADVGLVEVTGPTVPYVRGDKTLAFHHCPTCGCTTHWKGLNPDEPDAYMAVNLCLAEPEVMAQIPVRHFDGADTWEYLD